MYANVIFMSTVHWGFFSVSDPEFDVQEDTIGFKFPKWNVIIVNSTLTITETSLKCIFSRVSAHSGSGVGQHVRLHPSVHPDGRAPGPERRPRRRRLLQSPSPDLHCRGDSGHHLTRNHQFHRGAAGARLQHFRGERKRLSGVALLFVLRWTRSH